LKNEKGNLGASSKGAPSAIRGKPGIHITGGLLSKRNDIANMAIKRIERIIAREEALPRILQMPRTPERTAIMRNS